MTTLDQKLELHQRYSNITFRKFREKGKLIIEARQGKSFHENYFDAQRLREIVHETFDGEVDEPFHASGIPYSPPAHEVVTPEWLREKQKSLGLKSKDIIRDLGLDKTNYSAHLNGTREMGNSSKAMYYYYFKSKYGPVIKFRKQENGSFKDESGFH